MSGLFSEFPPVSTEQWMEVVKKDLKGQDFEKRLVVPTEDGIRVKPIYRSEDLPKGWSSGLARGSETNGRKWALREEVRESQVAKANLHALKCLGKGAEELACLTYPGGCQLSTPAEMQQLLEGIYIEAIPIHWIAGPLAPQTLALLIGEAERRSLPLTELKGSVDLDPILDSAAGWSSGSLETWKSQLIPALQVILQKLPCFGTLVVRGSLLEKAGASNAQELAFSLSLFADMLSGVKEALTEGSLTLPGAKSVDEAMEQIVARSEVRLAVGSTYFLEISKLRAARILLANLLDAFGISARPKIHVITTSATKTLYDSHNNLLRGTIEAMAGVIGGCDSLSVAAYDQGYNTPDEFSERLARNTEILLREEAHLGKVSDPLGGSYAVESLTDSMAQTAWSLFHKIEEEGGFVDAWKSGFIQKELERVRQAKIKAAGTRRASIVGTSSYPNLKEKKLKEIRPKAGLKKVKPAFGPCTSFAEVAEATKTQGALSFQSLESIGDSPLTAFRPSWPFESLRLRAEKHAESKGKAPVIQLVLFGEKVMRKARAGFCTGFFGSGGCEIRETVAESLTEAAHLEADLFVLCSSDAEYAEGAEAFMAGSPKSPVVVAGMPENSDVLTSLGVRGFVHIRQNVVDELTAWFDAFGIEPLNPEENMVPSSR
jgi:methylmalonyl-CoA mutase